MTEPTRRSLMKGAAWSVPVIALAATVPQAAASQTACVPLVAVSVCRFNGFAAANWLYTNCTGITRQVIVSVPPFVSLYVGGQQTGYPYLTTVSSGGTIQFRTVYTATIDEVTLLVRVNDGVIHEDSVLAPLDAAACT